MNEQKAGSSVRVWITGAGNSAVSCRFCSCPPTGRGLRCRPSAAPWTSIHTATRNWNTHTDRAMFPLRGLVPIKRDGLLGAGKNIGVSSIVQSALRLHGQMMLAGLKKYVEGRATKVRP